MSHLSLAFCCRWVRCPLWEKLGFHGTEILVFLMYTLTGFRAIVAYVIRPCRWNMWSKRTSLSLKIMSYQVVRIERTMLTLFKRSIRVAAVDLDRLEADCIEISICMLEMMRSEYSHTLRIFHPCTLLPANIHYLPPSFHFRPINLRRGFSWKSSKHVWRSLGT